MDSPTEDVGTKLLAGRAALYMAALAKAITLLQSAEFDGTCADEGACHCCAWDSDRDSLVDKWKHLVR